MHILCLGLNYVTTPIALREKLAFSEDQIRATLSRLGHDPFGNKIIELVLISTCNRTEFYAVLETANHYDLEMLLCEVKGVSQKILQPFLYHYSDIETVKHLFDVSAGLDSQVIGEPQILGQIAHALELARGQNAAGPMTNRLFLAAIHAGKRARTETAISRNPASISSLAASVAEQAVGNISAASVVVLGAGEMAELTVEALRKRGAIQIRVINRTLERAQKLAACWGANAATYEYLEKSLSETDILISSTSAPHTVISVEMVRGAHRENRPLVLIDIALPRDIDPECANLPGVIYYDIDSLNVQLENSLAKREAEIPRVRAILGEELMTFGEYLKSLEMLPLIVGIRQTAEQIRQAELERTLRRLPDLTDEERKHINALTHALVNKLLDKPTRHLRAKATSPHAPVFASVTRTLFGVEDTLELYEQFGYARLLSNLTDESLIPDAAEFYSRLNLDLLS